MTVNAPPPHGVLSVVDGSLSRFPGGLVGITVRGRYRIESVIHEAGDTAIFRATHLASARPMALRVLAPASSDDARREFTRVTSLVVDLEHRQLPRFVDRGETEDGLLFVAFELRQGRSLADIDVPMDPTRAVKLVAQALHGLRYLHGREIVHGSLSPQSLFVATDGDGVETVKIVEFGTSVSGSARPLTVAGLMAGTPGYIAPEQIGGSEVDHRVDLYAVGVMFYELLTGLPAWGTRDADEVLELQLGQSLPPLPANLSNFDSLVQRLAAREPTDRFSSATAALEALEESVMGRQRPARRLTPPEGLIVPAAAASAAATMVPRAVWIGAAAIAMAGLLALLARGGADDDAPQRPEAVAAALEAPATSVSPPATAEAARTKSAAAATADAPALARASARPAPPAPTAATDEPPPQAEDPATGSRRDKTRRRRGSKPRGRRASGPGETSTAKVEETGAAPNPVPAPEAGAPPTPPDPPPTPLASPAATDSQPTTRAADGSPLMSSSKRRGPSADALLQ